MNKPSVAPFKKLGNSPAALECFPAIADHLKGRWSPDAYTIGDAVQTCCPKHLTVAVMEAIRQRTYPLSVNAWEHMTDRSEASVLAMLLAAA